MDERFGSRGPPLNVGVSRPADASSGWEASRRSVSHSARLNAALELEGFDAGLFRLTVEEHAACEEEEFPPFSTLARQLQGFVPRRLGGPCGAQDGGLPVVGSVHLAK